MIDLTLQQLFGANAKQDSHLLIIQKSDLLKLTPLVDNRSEQLLVAILIQAFKHFEGFVTDELGEPIIDPHNRLLTYDSNQLYEKLNIRYWKRQFVKGYILDTFVVEAFMLQLEPGIVLTSGHLNY